jgi:hypothetical protein
MRYLPAIARTIEAASATGRPAAVTYNGRTAPEAPRTTGTACVAEANGVFATPITGTPNSA